MKNNYTLYMHIFPNNKVYIGITFQKPKQRWKKGKQYNEYMKKAIQKYGWENIKHEILYENLSKEEAEQKISQATCQAMNNPEIRKKISLAKIGKPSPRKGVKLTLEQRKKLSEAHKKDKNKTEINVSNAILGGI